jgi:RNA polymerase sigma-70 factor (ECF subfamily)
MHDAPQHPGNTREASDEDLMMDFAGGSLESFNTLFSRYKQPIFGFFCRRMADRSQSEELTQETFIAVLRAAPRYQPSALFRTWLYAIALRILQNHRRKSALRACVFGFAENPAEPSSRENPDAAILLRETVVRLDPIDREIVLLREYEQLNYTEIAQLLKIPLNTVRSRLFRARAALRELLEAPAVRNGAANSPIEEGV